MVFPKFKNKHLEKALISPKNLHEYTGHTGARIPRNCIILYYDNFFRNLKRKYKPMKLKETAVGAEFYKLGKIGIIKINGIGSPHAVTVLEEAIDLGGRNFINVGTAGGLDMEGIFLCSKALRDEGTSYHYLPHGHFSHPDIKLTERLGKFMEEMGIKYKKAPTWTIDAPDRETVAEVNKYKKMGIATVEMEASALFAVANLRKVKIASAFVVSDILGKEWNPKFNHIDTKRGLEMIFKAAVKCLS